MSAKLFTITVLIFVALAFVMFVFIDSFDNKVSEATGLVVNDKSFPVYLETHPLIGSLPKSAEIGVKIGESSYEIDGRNVISGDNFDDKDIIVRLPGGYDKIIGNIGLCEAIKQANENKELVVETFINKASLLLKYRNLLKYSECLE